MAETPVNGNADRHFRTEHLEAGLKGRAVRGAAVTLVAQAVSLVMYTVGTAVLARRLGPGPYGLVLKVTALVSFVTTLRDFGLAQAMVQRKELTHEETSTLFWVNASLSVAACAVTAALAPVVAWFYGDPKLTVVTLAIAGTVLVEGLCVQHSAILRRQMRFLALAATTQASLAVGYVAGITAAYLKMGYWSLVIMQAANVVACTAGMWIVTGWRPGRAVFGKGVREMLAFGAHLAAFNVPGFFGRCLDQILIGRSQGDRWLGLYSKAQNILTLPVRQISSPVATVAVPTLSRLQAQPERYRNYYLSALSLIAFLVVPLSAACIVFSEETVRVFLGKSWADAAWIFRLMGIGAVAMPLTSTTGWLFVSRGRGNELLKYGTIGVVVTVASFIIGLPWGARGVALAASCATLAWTPFGTHFAVRGTGITLGDAFGALVQPLLAAAAASAVALALKCLAAAGEWNVFLTLGVGCAIFSGVYVAVVLVVFRRKDFFLSVYQSIREG